MREKREPVKVMEKACPLCGSDIKGNEKILYYCKRCNLLFKIKTTKKNSP
ncbi:MAG: hypothetical protein Q7J54_04780 [Candidatus Woesearchaeota archaeon]|nr:hypothetical protein [Candidatus Woesearchaeota archaeon]